MTSLIFSVTLYSRFNFSNIKPGPLCIPGLLEGPQGVQIGPFEVSRVGFVEGASVCRDSD